MNEKVFIPKGGAKRLAIQACSRPADPRRGFLPQKGIYHDVEPIEMAATCIYETCQGLPGFTPLMVDTIIYTTANPVDTQNMTGRTMANYLGANRNPEWFKVSGSQLNQLCMSGIRGQGDAANMLVSPFMLGNGPHVIVVVGLEKMTECLLQNIFNKDYSPAALKALGPKATAMGFTAEMTADSFSITKTDCDQLAVTENERYRAALTNGWFADEIVPITVKGQVITKDASANPLSMDNLGKEVYYFRAKKKGGVLTANTSSQMSDGSAVVVLCNEDAIKKYGWEPAASLEKVAIGVAPKKYMGEGLISAFEAYVALMGLTVEKFLATERLYELNTAFASIPLALIKKYGLPMDFINVCGGATTPIGHPLGATGVRLVVTLLNQMRRLKIKYGYAGACVGEGQGGAIGYQNLLAA